LGLIGLKEAMTKSGALSIQQKTAIKRILFSNELHEEAENDIECIGRESV
jgi:hypothetical protein